MEREFGSEKGTAAGSLKMVMIIRFHKLAAPHSSIRKSKLMYLQITFATHSGKYTNHQHEH